jgi:hypothetical protein
MKLAVAACVSICLCLGSLAVRSLVLRSRDRQLPAAQPAARAAPRGVDKRALATLDNRLHRKLRQLALASADVR